MEELAGLFVIEAAVSCLATAELTNGFPDAIAAKLSPQEAAALTLSPIATTAQITSFVQFSAKIVFIILLLFNFESFEQGGERLFPQLARSRTLMPRPQILRNANQITTATFSQHGLTH